MHVIYIISGAWIDMNEQKERILKGTIQAFNEKGLKFTMDDLARILGMSKKTIYVEFTDKNSLFLAMVDYLFDGIKESEEEIINNTDIDIVDKITTMLGVLPESYKDIDLRQLYMLKDKYPVIYKRVEERFENGWQQIIELLKEAMEEGKVRKVNVDIFKMMMEAALEQFFQRDILIYNSLSYEEGLKEVVGILMNGIKL
jgi:AcrR family transcriptional regulator